MLMNCPHCGNKISSNAKFCPNCKKEPNKIKEKIRKAVCRTCAGEIDSSYRYVEHSTSESKEQSIQLQNLGNNNYSGTVYERHKTHYHRDVYFRPCPHCGESKPIKFFADTWVATLIRYGLIQIPAFALLSGAIICSFFILKWPEAVTWIVFCLICCGLSLFFEDKWTRSGRHLHLLFSISILIPIEMIVYYYFQDDIDYVTKSIFGITIDHIFIYIGYYSGYYWIIDAVNEFFGGAA